MKKIARALGYLALAAVILPPLAYMLRFMSDLSLVKGMMLAGTIVWFVTAPLWMERSSG